VDYPKVCGILQQKISERGGRVVTGAKVIRLQPQSNGWLAQSTAGDFETDFLVNCAGLYSDRIGELAGEKREVRIVPFRGEYYKIKRQRQQLVRNLIYPVPDPQFPFLGVHFTRLIYGGIEAGPNAVLAFAREGYRKTDFDPADFFDALTFSGLWRFLAQHKRMSWEELKRSFSRRLFCECLQRLGAGNSPGRPRNRRRGRPRAGHVARRHAGPGFLLPTIAQIVACAQRTQSCGDRLAGDWRRNRPIGMEPVLNRSSSDLPRRGPNLVCDFAGKMKFSAPRLPGATGGKTL